MLLLSLESLFFLSNKSLFFIANFAVMSSIFLLSLSNCGLSEFWACSREVISAVSGWGVFETTSFSRLYSANWKFSRETSRDNLSLSHRKLPNIYNYEQTAIVFTQSENFWSIEVCRVNNTLLSHIMGHYNSWLVEFQFNFHSLILVL